MEEESNLFMAHSSITDVSNAKCQSTEFAKLFLGRRCCNNYIIMFVPWWLSAGMLCLMKKLAGNGVSIKRKSIVLVRSGAVQVDTTALTDSGFSPFTDSNNLSTASSHSSYSGSSTETWPRKFRSLAEIYESCSLALLAADPICSEDVAKQAERRNAMLKEMQAIEKEHCNLSIIIIVLGTSNHHNSLH